MKSLDIPAPATFPYITAYELIDSAKEVIKLYQQNSNLDYLRDPKQIDYYNCRNKKRYRV
jgi:hypothetical protein